MASTLWFLVLSVSVFFTTLVRAQQTFFPAAVPVNVRSPYLNVWAPSTNGSLPLSNAWPEFWGQAAIMGWVGKIRIDGVTYGWLGNDQQKNASATVTDFQITPTRSIYVMQAGPMNVTVTFLSPIEPSDWVKQSIPFSYVSVEASSTDGASHDVQVYSDISAEWASGNRSDLVKWTTQSTGTAFYQQIELQNPQSFVEINNQASDGTVYHAMASTPGMTWQVDVDATVRNQFWNEGTLTNVASTAFGPINNPFPVFAISVDLGTITTTANPVTWAVGYVRDPSIQYTTPTGETQNRRPYYATEYSDVSDVIDAFMSDFSAANDRAVALDAKIRGAATNISSNYVDLVSLGARQTFGALDITTYTDSDGKIDPTDVLIFMKDIGTSRRVNPVERMFTAFPTYLYLNASLCGPMLAPLMNQQDSLSGQAYAAQDIGTSYPIAPGNHGAHTQGIEESGNMLIMAYAHARFSGDGTLLGQHYTLLKRWADYLVNNTLTFSGQTDADGENAANMTNLAIKGIIGVKAMAEIATAVGEKDDAQSYNNQASALVGAWQALAASTTNSHLLGVYSDQTSWALLYNLYADVLLGTGLVSQSLLSDQTTFYSSIVSTAPEFGLPIDSSAGQTSSASWTLLTAASVTDETVRNQLISGVWSRASNNLTVGTFPDQYNDATGAIVTGTASPALGAMFSHLALTLSNTTIVVPPDALSTGSNTSSSTKSKSNVGAIVGGVIGGLVVVGLIGAAAYRRWSRKRAREQYDAEKIDVLSESVHRPTLSPYYYELANQNTQSQAAIPRTPPGPGSDYGQSQYGQSQYTDPGVAGLGAATVTGDPTREATAGGSSGSESGTMYNPYDLANMSPAAASKAREAGLIQPQYHHGSQPSLSMSSAFGSSQALPSHRGDPTSPDSLSPTSRVTGETLISPTEVIGLRTEVENLRRVMQEIRAERLEPPPEYEG